MIEPTQINKDNKQEKAILVSICNRRVPFEQAKEYLDELAFLTKTAGAKAVRSFIQRLEKPVNATYIGSGKLEEVKQAIEEEEADMVVFDDDLTPSQVRNIDKILDVKVLDRSAIILHIFSNNAQTAQARTQVDLAHSQYMLPRLAGLWSHLSKQKGGIGMKGAGEKEIETDRRILRKKIDLLRKNLQKIEQQGSIRRKNRTQFVRTALVGYTNVGKSTLMNLLTKSDILAENKLFATLDTTVRKMTFKGVPFLVSDTVGFIRKLPHHLVECFKSTLAEAQESDILLHVVDVSHPKFEDQIEVVKATLQDVNVDDKKVIMVFNKIDLLDEEARKTLEEAWYGKENAPAIFISAGQKEGIEELRTLLIEMIMKTYDKKFPRGNPYKYIYDSYNYVAE